MARNRSIGSKASPRDRVRAGNTGSGGGSGGASRGGGSGGGSGRGPSGPPRKWKRIAKRILIWGGALALLATIALGTAVYFAAQGLPSFSELKDTKAGQTIV